MEINWSELYGIEMPSGEEAQGAADPAEPTSNGTEVPDAAAQTDTYSEPDAGAASNAEGDTSEDGEQTDRPRGDDAAYAAARRKAEREKDLAIQEANRRAEQAVDDFIAQAGILNPMTGQPIKTRAEYDAYQTEYAAKQKEQVQKKTGMTDAEIQQFIDALPEVREARVTKAQAEQAQQEARAAEARTRAEEQLREISKLDPGVKTLEDITKMDTYPAFYEHVKAGVSLLDAFKLANFDRLQAASAAAGQQQARNAAAGKGHLGRTQQRGQGTTPIPEETMELYRQLNPDVSEEEIRAHWQRSHT